MSYIQDEYCVLLADVTGSTALYSRVGDVEALAAISAYVESVKSIITRHNGEFIHSRGDDILSIYLDPTDALAATRDMLKVRSESGLTLHAGLHFGAVVRTDDDIYGDTVNIAARLSTTANTDEVLISSSFADLEDGKFKEELRFINHVDFKGKDEPMAVYTLRPVLVNATKTQIGAQTQFNDPLPNAKEIGVSVELILNGKSYFCSDNETMILGRADHCEVLDPSPWVSREHAVIEVKGDKVNLTDRSSGSTYVKMGDGHEVSIVRQSIMLAGSGIISLALSTEAPNVNPIQFRIIYG
ncbi:MAG: adenylate/guanylate cyclase domain-containing protein [Rhizobiaceae bacterium]